MRKVMKKQCNLRSCRSLFSSFCRLAFKLKTRQFSQMEVDGEENENSSPPLYFEDFPQRELNLQNEAQLFPEMENRLQKLFTELQMYRVISMNYNIIFFNHLIYELISISQVWCE